MTRIVTTLKNSQWLCPLISDSLAKRGIQVELYSKKTVYPDDTIFSIGGEIRDKSQWKHLANYRIVVEYMGEANCLRHGSYYRPTWENILFMYGAKKNSDNNNIRFNSNFFWYDLAIDYTARGYNQYKPNKNYIKKFFMPIRRAATWRRNVLNNLSEFLPDSIYSMHDDGIRLPGSNKNLDKREIRKEWFDDTHFSMVLETYFSPDMPIFITEKIMKAIAFYHPYQVIASPGYLKDLKDLGFESFENLFDESYDSIADFDNKMMIIKKNVVDYRYEPYDKLTLEKLEHNFNLFYDMDKVKKGIEIDFIDQVMDWISNK